MTAPTFDNWLSILVGWLFSPRRTITGILIAAGVAGKRHHSAYHRFFASARWSLDRLGLAIADLVLLLLPRDEVVFGALDDTLARKCGRKIFGAGMHHDPLQSSRGKAIVARGHSWVVFAILVQLPFTGTWFALPVLFRLYRNKKTAPANAYRTRPQLAVDMLHVLAARFPERRFHVLGDSAYGGASVARHLPAGFDLTTRMHFDAEVYAMRPKRRKKGPGRPRKRGDRLPSPRQLLADRRGRIRALDLYGRRDKIRFVTQTCLWYRVLPDRPIKFVAVQPLSGGRKPQAFYTTDVSAKAEEILSRYARRWSIEMTFREAKQRLGFEQPQGWSERAVLRTAPMAMLIYSLVVIWFARRPRKASCATPKRPWFRQRQRVSFADMLATLKRACVRETVSSHPRRSRHLPKHFETLLVHCAGAA
jgi:SRSO17 transposase